MKEVNKVRGEPPRMLEKIPDKEILRECLREMEVLERQSKPKNGQELRRKSFTRGEEFR